MRDFDRSVASVEARTQAFISEAFGALRSSEGAFDVLSKLSTLPMRDSLRALLHSNATNIITKARAELEALLRQSCALLAATAAPPQSLSAQWATMEPPQG